MFYHVLCDLPLMVSTGECTHLYIYLVLCYLPLKVSTGACTHLYLYLVLCNLPLKVPRVYVSISLPTLFCVACLRSFPQVHVPVSPLWYQVIGRLYSPDPQHRMAGVCDDLMFNSSPFLVPDQNMAILSPTDNLLMDASDACYGGVGQVP